MTQDDWDCEKSSKSEIIVGEELSIFSQQELEERLTKINQEIVRVKAAIEANRSQADVAHGLFKSDT